MRNPHTAIIGTMIGAALLVLSASLACGREDHERIAEDVAREWAMTEADGISEEIAAMATRRYGGRVFVQIGDDDSISPSNASAVGNLPHGERIPTAAAADQIQRTIQWEFGPPTRKGDGHYEVIATASISFDIAPSESSDTVREMPDLISLLKRPYTGSVDYELDVDTTSREVKNANMPLTSVRIRGMSQGRILY